MPGGHTSTLSTCCKHLKTCIEIKFMVRTSGYDMKQKISNGPKVSEVSKVSHSWKVDGSRITSSHVHQGLFTDSLLIFLGSILANLVRESPGAAESGLGVQALAGRHCSCHQHLRKQTARHGCHPSPVQSSQPSPLG